MYKLPIMALASAAVVLPAAAVALMAMALQLSAAAATAPIGQPGCNTTCGDVTVPYPFGFGRPCSADIKAG